MARALERFIESQLRAVCSCLYADRAAALQSAGLAVGPADRAAGFALFVLASAPAFVRFGVRTLACALVLASILKRGRSFAGSSSSERASHLATWRSARLAAMRDFVRFFDSLVLFDMVQ